MEARCACCGYPCDPAPWPNVYPRCDRCRMDCAGLGGVRGGGRLTSCGLPMPARLERNRCPG